MTIKEIKKKYGLDNTFLSEIFEYSSLSSFSNSSAKKRIERALERFYKATRD